jgi:hypothetical protein
VVDKTPDTAKANDDDDDDDANDDDDESAMESADLSSFRNPRPKSMNTKNTAPSSKSVLSIQSMDSRVSLLEETTEKIQQQNNEILALLRQQMTNHLRPRFTDDIVKKSRKSRMSRLSEPWPFFSSVLL